MTFNLSHFIKTLPCLSLQKSRILHLVGVHLPLLITREPFHELCNTLYEHLPAVRRPTVVCFLRGMFNN